MASYRHSKKANSSEKYEKAKSLLLPLAEKNNAEAQLLLRYLYCGGDNKTTAKQSQYWLERSAKNKNAEAIALVASTNFKIGSWSNEPGSQEAIDICLYH